MQDQPAPTTFLFTDIEGSTRLWEEEPERMRPSLARHDALIRSCVEAHRGVVVKTTGDGVHAAFVDPMDALAATLRFQQALNEVTVPESIALQVRCGLHAGIVERRDNDFFGSPVNRAARIMSAAHGGQILVSHAVATLVKDRLPQDVKLHDLGSVRLRDLATPEHVYQVVHPDLRREFPALRSLEATPNNLPQQVTSFIGRERELVEVKQLLGKSRLLTLVGVGGLGKTRLSLHVAADMMDAYPDGVWFVELAPLADARLVPQAVASVLGVKEQAGHSLQEALVKHVKDRHLLLILDNCEHLVHACAELAKQLLQSSVHIRVLASSREFLHVNGEITYAVPPLSFPTVAQRPTVAEATRCEAVRLFVDRASAAQPTFEITDQNATVLVDICRRLDGIPLAIELAAARVRTLSVEKIGERLSDRFRLLTGGDRTALPRQQTLRALIDWSYDLLTDDERTLLRQLSVFAGGWTLEAAEAVGATDDLAPGDVLDILTKLVEKSLVVLQAQGARYTLLESVREYAKNKLDHAGENEDAARRHLAFFLQFAEQARPQLVGKDQGLWLTRIDDELENLLAAHACCNQADDRVELGLRLVSAVKIYWICRGLVELGQQVTVEALTRPGAGERTPARCRTLFDAGQLISFMGRYAEAQQYLNESLAIARQIGDTERIAAVLQPLAQAAFGQGDSPRAGAYLNEALALARKLGNKRGVAAALNNLAQIHRAQGELDAAEPLYREVLALARELGDRESIAIGLLNLAMVAIGRGSGEAARQMLLEVVVIVEETRSKPTGQSLLDVSAGLCALLAEPERAARFFGAAENQMGQTGLQRDPADEAFLAPLVLQARAACIESRFAAAEASGRSLSYEAAIAEARAWLEKAPLSRSAETIC